MQDYSDPDVIRVNDDYFMVASSFNQIPGLPILHSKNLVDWRLVNYVYDKLPSPYYDTVRHGDGSWAPSLRYHDGIYYCMIPMPDDGIYESHTEDIYGKWSPLHLMIPKRGLEDPCPICSDSRRDSSIICVIESQSEMLAIEETGSYKGQYHILGGALDPLSGKGPDSLRINELLHRLNSGNFVEVLIATNPTVEGESTFLYLQNMLSGKNYKISRIATGIPMGGSLEYTDKFTLSKALSSKHYL